MNIIRKFLIVSSLVYSTLCFAAKLPLSTLELTSSFSEIEASTSQPSWESYYKSFYVFIVAKAGQEISPREVVFPLVEIALKEKIEAWIPHEGFGIFGRFVSEQSYFNILFNVIFGDNLNDKCEAHRILKLNFNDIPAYEASVRHHRYFAPPWSAVPVFNFRF